ncbi:MAG: FMN-binding protein [Bacilli bacterium]
MKKLAMVLAVITLFLTVGCGQKGYKEGTYQGSALDSYGGQNNKATASIKIDKEGNITDVSLDTTYTTKDGKQTTKKALKEAYGMKEYAKTQYEWYQQIEFLEKAIIKEQNIDFLKLDNDGFTDTVSGCTIKIDALYKAINDALIQAK